MEVVVIDKVTFERMLSGFENLAEKVERLCREHGDLGEREWLDSNDVWQAARYQSEDSTDDEGERNAGLHQDKHKVYYKPEDVKAVFPSVGMKRRMTAVKGRECNIINQ